MCANRKVIIGAFKLVALIGGLEIVGVIQSGDRDTDGIIRLLYSTLRGLRGVFIFFAYVVFNKKVVLVVKVVYQSTVQRLFPEGTATE